MLEPNFGEEPVPDLTHEDTGRQKMVGRLVILVTERAFGILLESMALTAFRSPKAAV